MNEIASVALLPRNDTGNSRIPQSRDPRVKLGDDKKRSQGMTQGLGILDGILNEIASVALLPRNDGILEFPIEILGQAGG